MSTILVDRQGTVWEQGSSELRQHYGAHCSDAAFEKFLIRNLGFIGVSQSDRSCSIRASSARLTFASYATLSQLLSELDPHRVAVSIIEKEATHSIVSGPAQALNLLIHTAWARPDAEFERFSARERPMDSIHGLEPLAALLDIWRQHSGHISVDDHPRIFDDALKQRFVIIDRDTDKSKLTFARIGKGFVMYDKGWAERLIGCPVDHQPDLHYARNVAASWADAFKKGCPTLTDVDAVITNPVENASRTVSYSRLTLPITSSLGTDQLLSASLVYG